MKPPTRGRRKPARGPCEYGGRRCTARGVRMTDPFASEVDGADDEMLLCGPCAQDRADDA